MLVSKRYTSQEPVLPDWPSPVLPDWPSPVLPDWPSPVLPDWPSPVLPDWSASAMGVPSMANQPGKPLFGNGEHLATVGQH
jgi:hypothetical protein